MNGYRIETQHSGIDGWEWFVIDRNNKTVAAGTGYHCEDCIGRAKRWIRNPE